MKMITDTDDGIEIETKKSEEFEESGKQIVILKFHVEGSSSLGEGDKEKIIETIKGLEELNPDKFLIEDGNHFIVVAAIEKTEALERLNWLLRQLLSIDKIRARNNGDGKLYVGNIPYTATESDLTRLFSEAGKVKKISIIIDENKQSRGFAFVEMSTPAEASKAKEMLNGHQFKGRTLKVADVNK